MKKTLLAIGIALLLTVTASAQMPTNNETQNQQPEPTTNAQSVISPNIQIPEPENNHETDLTLRVETIRDRRRAFTSLTDLHGLDILTPASAQMEKRYRDLMQQIRQQSVNELFEIEAEPLSGPERILLRTETLGLFRQTEDERFLREPTAYEAPQTNYILYGGIVVILCAGGFLISNHLHKRKRKGKKHVSNIHLAATGKGV